MKDWVVYKHTSPHGKVYIGITSRPPNLRWQNGLGYQSNEHFHNAIVKYGWENFSHEILYEHLSKEHACDLEKALIREYDSRNPSKGYNVLEGGECYAAFAGHHHTEDSKAKIAERSRELWKNPKYRAIMRKVVSPEHHPMKGRKQPTLTALNKARAKAVQQLNAEGTVMATFSSIRDAERQTEISHSSISAACNGYRGTKSAGGYHWKYANDRETI